MSALKPAVETMLFTFVLSTLCTLSFGAQVIVIGDSWGEEGHEYLQDVLKSHANTKDLEVKSYAVGGTTTANWIKPPTKVVDDINKNSDAQYVWLTIGGNDAGTQNYISLRNIAHIIHVQYTLQQTQ